MSVRWTPSPISSQTEDTVTEPLLSSTPPSRHSPEGYSTLTTPFSYFNKIPDTWWPMCSATTELLREPTSLTSMITSDMYKAAPTIFEPIVRQIALHIENVLNEYFGSLRNEKLGSCENWSGCLHPIEVSTKYTYFIVKWTETMVDKANHADALAILIIGRLVLHDWRFYEFRY